MPPPNPKPSRLMHLALVASAVLVVVALVVFWLATKQAKHAQPKTSDNAVQVVINDKTCEPNAIAVPAGRTTFTIVNQSNRALEWEILDGVMVVEERENIAPGFTQTMTVKLEPGQFQITCGLLSNPRGTLRVTPSSASRAEAASPTLVNFIGPLAEYRVYLMLQTSALQEAISNLASAIKAGNLEKAQALYGPAHQAYKRIEPVAALFSDLDTRINARAQYFQKREADPGFSGFHRIGYALFSQNSVQGLSTVVGPLVADVGTLEQRLGDLSIKPEQLAESAARLLRRVAGNLSADNAALYSHSQPADLQGTLDGTRKIADLLAPLLTKAAPDLQKDITQRFVAFDTALAPYRQGDGFKNSVLDNAQRKALAAPVGALADDFDKINPALGLK